ETVDALINQGELPVDRGLLDRAPRLKIVSNVAIGTDNLDLDELTARGIWATNAPDAFTESTADCGMALLLAVTRRIVVGDRYIRRGTWSEDGLRPVLWEGPLLSGKTLGVVGFGKIGQAMAERARAFGMQIIYHRRQSDPSAACVSLDDLLRQSDVVSLHTPLTPETEKMINAERIASMKPGAYLINMARGKVVDEQSLVDALQRGHLAGAGLDVFEREPEVHPDLLTMEQVVLVPHVGGAAREARRRARALAGENIVRVLKGGRPLEALNQLP
ncbi:MAG: D-glycerate dehydrogenase, partial [Verrucomicrobiota bacterium]